MAVTFYTDVAGTSGQTGLALSARPGSNKVSGVVLVAEATYTIVGTEVATDLIDIVKLPAGAKVIPHLSRITGEALGTTATLSVGDTDSSPSATRYSSALDIHAANDLTLTGGAASLTPFTLLTNCWIQAVFASLSTPTAAKKITFRIAYTLS